MSSDLLKNVRNGTLAGGDIRLYMGENTPKQYADRQYPYFNRNSALFP